MSTEYYLDHDPGREPLSQFKCLNHQSCGCLAEVRQAVLDECLELSKLKAARTEAIIEELKQWVETRP